MHFHRKVSSRKTGLPFQNPTNPRKFSVERTENSEPEFLGKWKAHYDILAITRGRITTATFSHQNDAGSRARTTLYQENLVLVVVVVLESKGL